MRLFVIVAVLLSIVAGAHAETSSVTREPADSLRRQTIGGAYRRATHRLTPLDLAARRQSENRNDLLGRQNATRDAGQHAESTSMPSFLPRTLSGF